MSELTESTLFNANQYLINKSKRLTEESRLNGEKSQYCTNGLFCFYTDTSILYYYLKTY